MTFRAVPEDIRYRPGPIDPVESAAVHAIKTAEENLSHLIGWRHATGSEAEAAFRGFGAAVAEIVDSVRRLRAQMLGSEEEKDP